MEFLKLILVKIEDDFGRAKSRDLRQDGDDRTDTVNVSQWKVYFIGSIGILKMSMMKSDEELCERKANIDGMDQG